MGGAIGVDSVEGRGSTFWFKIPLLIAEEAPVSPAAPVSPVDFAGRRILLVDDHLAATEILGRYLRGWGAEVTSVARAADALGELRRGEREKARYDVAILDKRMPDLDGLELARQIHADPMVGTMPLILSTAFDRAALKEDALTGGFAAFLRKPGAPGRAVQGTGPGARAGSRGGNPKLNQQNRRRRPVRRSPDPMRADHILVAEDNVVNQRLLLTQLRSLGLQAQVVVNGYEALEALAHGEFALVLMDCHMPEMDGLETTRAIRAGERQKHADRSGALPRLPILALTADVLPENRALCTAAGMDGFLTKPVRKEQLREALSHWLVRDNALVPAN